MWRKSNFPSTSKMMISGVSQSSAASSAIRYCVSLSSGAHPAWFYSVPVRPATVRPLSSILTDCWRSFELRRPSYRTLVFLLFDHIGGINTLLHTLIYGGTVVTTDDRRPDAVCAAVDRHRVQLLPATPTFLRMLVIAEAAKRYDLGSLEIISYGTEPMPASTLAAVRETLPWVRLKQTYGLSEAGILQTQSPNSDSLGSSLGSSTGSSMACCGSDRRRPCLVT